MLQNYEKKQIGMEKMIFFCPQSITEIRIANPPPSNICEWRMHLNGEQAISSCPEDVEGASSCSKHPQHKWFAPAHQSGK